MSTAKDRLERRLVFVDKTIAQLDKIIEGFHLIEDNATPLEDIRPTHALRAVYGEAVLARREAGKQRLRVHVDMLRLDEAQPNGEKDE